MVESLLLQRFEIVRPDLHRCIAEDYADPETDWREALGRVARCIHYLSGGQLLPPTLELLTLTLVIHDLLVLLVLH